LRSGFPLKRATGFYGGSFAGWFTEWLRLPLRSTILFAAWTSFSNAVLPF
jgi:hypothetical protein